MKLNYKFLENLELLSIKKVKEYNVASLISIIFLSIALLVTFIFVILPQRHIVLIIGFGLGLIAAAYNLINEIFFPSRQNFYVFSVPKDYKDWPSLYLMTQCVSYDIDNSVIVLRFSKKLEKVLNDYLDTLI